MTRLLAASLALFLVVSPTSADEKYKPKGAGYSIEFPGEPKVKTQTTKTDLGDLEVVTATYATSRGDVYLASHTKFPPKAVSPELHATLFDGVREGVKGKDGKVDSEKPVTLGDDKLPGRDIRLTKGDQHARLLVVVKGDKLIQVLVLGSKQFVGDDDAEDFLQSLEFDD